MKNIIRDLRELSTSGILAIYLSDKKIRLISSSNIVGSLQRVLPEIPDGKRIKVIQNNIQNKRMRSLLCYIHKNRLEKLGYKVKSKVHKWWLDKRPENINGNYKWVLRAKNRCGEIVLGVFEINEMNDFTKRYYPGEKIAALVVSSNEATKRYILEHPEY